MNIALLIKQVPDTGLTLRIDEEKSLLKKEGLKWILSPYDEFAIEESLRLKKEMESKLFAITLGPSRSREVCRTALALGVDEAFHLISDQDIFDPLLISQILSEKIKTLDSVSLVFCGKLATDNNNFAVPQMVSYFLKFPCVTNVNKLHFEKNHLLLKREGEGGREETLKAPLPLVLSADKGLNTPRYPSLPGIMQAKKKPLHESPASLKKETIKIKSLSPPAKRPKPQMLEGDAKKQVSDLIQILKEKEKLL